MGGWLCLRWTFRRLRWGVEVGVKASTEKAGIDVSDTEHRWITLTRAIEDLTLECH